MSTAAREEGIQAERIEMSFSCVVWGGGLLGTRRSRIGLGEGVLVTQAGLTSCAKNGGMSWGRICSLKDSAEPGPAIHHHEGTGS